MVNQTALESLVQRGRSDFYKDLVSLYQESFDALQEAYNASGDEVYIALKNIDFFNRLKSIVRTRMGVTLTSVVLLPGKYANMMISYALPKLPFRNIQTLSSGTILAAIANHYDDRKGTFDDVIRDQKIARYSLGITASCWQLRNDDKSFFCTADEMAASTLHEMGHVDWWTQQASHAYGVMVTANDIVTYVTEHPDRKVILDLIDHVEKSPYFDKSWKGIIQAMRTYFGTATDITDPTYTEALSTLCASIAAETASRNLSYVKNLVDDSYAKIPSITQHLDAERNADEFASRHGAYSANVKGLKKGGELDTTHSGIMFKPFMPAPVALAATLLTTFIGLFYLPSENVKNGYDPLIARMRLILQTAKHTFQDPELPEAIKADLHIQIAEIEECINAAQSSTHFKLRQALKSWKDNLTKFGRIAKTPFENRLQRDYGKLQDATRAIGRHSLYYLADKTK